VALRLIALSLVLIVIQTIEINRYRISQQTYDWLVRLIKLVHPLAMHEPAIQEAQELRREIVLMENHIIDLEEQLASHYKETMKQRYLND
jgi:hypothetical protein